MSKGAYVLLVYGKTTCHSNELPMAMPFIEERSIQKCLPFLTFWRLCKHYRICFEIWLFEQPVCMRNRFWCTLRGNISWKNCSISKLPYGKVSLTFQEASCKFSFSLCKLYGWVTVYKGQKKLVGNRTPHPIHRLLYISRLHQHFRNQGFFDVVKLKVGIKQMDKPISKEHTRELHIGTHT